MQKILPELGIPRENIVFISGIGCSSRFPYYMNTYGIHSIHGRAPTLATGLKIANPELSVWVITGDGDGLSIGGNHLLHAIRRNIDIKIILFNNRIYGLTKGQYSPTSLPGAVTKSSPMGTIEQSFNPISVAIGAEATFVARTVDTHVNHMADVLKRAAEHKGTAFVEVFQNCVIFNDGAWDHVTDKAVKDDNTLVLEHGEPMIFGKDQDRGIVFDGFDPKVVHLGDGYSEADLMVHDETRLSPAYAYLLSQMDYPNFPVPIGVFRSVEKPSYADEVIAQVNRAVARKGEGDLHKLYMDADTWVVTEEHYRAGISGDVTPELDEEYIDQIDQEVVIPSAVRRGLLVDPISDLIDGDMIIVTPQTSLADAITQMQERKIGSVLVVDEAGKLVGIFTEMDILQRVACLIRDLASAEIGDFMTPSPSSVRQDKPIAHALHLMSLYHFRHVPIVDEEDRPVGVASFRDVVHFLERYF
jgi:2-oxoglutarate ferredoxin oxidoreductase subunit beta